MFAEWTPPAATEVEVSIFGRGSGESILVHLGDGKWIVVDSFRVGGQPIALRYLDALGVDVGVDVALVLATHWHDDHIHGLADTYAQATSAAASFPQAMTGDEFRQFAAQFTSIPAGKISSGVEELGKILLLMEERNWGGVAFASAWKTLLRYGGPDMRHAQPIEVAAMSPSDFDVIQFLQFIARSRIPSDSANTAVRAPHYDRNEVSCALHIRIGRESIVLGADLENVPNPSSGWKAVFASQQLPQRTATLLKIPHHGSVTGHHPGIWSRLCVTAPVATLTPWARGDGRLPKRDDIVRISGLTGEAYSAAQTVTSGDRHPLQSVNSVLKKTNSRIRNIDPRLGHVRHRLDAQHADAVWETSLFGAACPLNEVAA